jgi:Domain of unknown function (DUF6777)
MADMQSRARRRWPVLAVIGLVAALGLGAIVLLLGGDDSAGVVLEPAAGTPAEPLLVELATATGDGSGAGQVATDVPAPELETLDDPVLLAGGRIIGTEPGLYAGTRDESTCDLDGMIELLTDEGKRERADEWFTALDRNVDDREEYLEQLTPVRLRFDTRVTTHDGDGRHPAVLQAGTPVLIDRFGVPRVRCAGGNPLDEPDVAPTGTTADESLAVQTHAQNSEDAWDGFDPAAVVVVEGGPNADAFDLADLAAVELFTRPVGTDGERDRGAWSGPVDDECEGCHEMRITIETVSGTPARLTYEGGGRPAQASVTELIWLEGTADPGLFTYTISHDYVGYLAIDRELGMDDPAIYDDPRYDDEDLVIDAPNRVVTECVPGDVTATISVDDVVAQTSTEAVPCEGSTFTYTLG